MKKALCIFMSILFVFGGMSVVLAAEEDFDSFGAYDHVIICGIDGLGAAWEKVDSPNFDRIFADDAYRYNAHTEYITTSAQNWGSILTGVAYDVHGFTNGWCEDNERDSTSDNHSIFYYARQQFPKVELVSFNHWSAINHGIIENDLNVRKVNRSTDPLVSQAVVSYFNEGCKPKLTFIQLDSVDHAAHTYGGFSDQYYDAAEKADTYMGEIYDAAERNGLLKNGLFIVVADHGETEDGHGGQTVEESSSILAVAGKSVNQVVLNEDVRNRDVAAIALYALGIEQPENMTAVLPPELFGACVEKTTPAAEKSALDALRRFLNYFVRMVNTLISIFDRTGIYY